MTITPLPRYGILAGHGALLTNVIDACRQQNLSFFILAFHGQTDIKAIEDHPFSLPNSHLNL